MVNRRLRATAAWVWLLMRHTCKRRAMPQTAQHQAAHSVAESRRCADRASPTPDTGGYRRRLKAPDIVHRRPTRRSPEMDPAAATSVTPLLDATGLPQTDPAAGPAPARASLPSTCLSVSAASLPNAAVHVGLAQNPSTCSRQAMAALMRLFHTGLPQGLDSAGSKALGSCMHCSQHALIMLPRVCMRRHQCHPDPPAAGQPALRNRKAHAGAQPRPRGKSRCMLPCNLCSLPARAVHWLTAGCGGGCRI